MPLHINAFPDHALTHAELEAWRAIPTSFASDELKPDEHTGCWSEKDFVEHSAGRAGIHGSNHGGR